MYRWSPTVRTYMIGRAQVRELITPDANPDRCTSFGRSELIQLLPVEADIIEVPHLPHKIRVEFPKMLESLVRVGCHYDLLGRLLRSDQEVHSLLDVYVRHLFWILIPFDCRDHDGFNIIRLNLLVDVPRLK